MKSKEFQNLQILRDRFLEDRPTADYWSNSELLHAYDATFAQRISWKWQRVLEDCKTRKFEWDPKLPIVDWGCGTAIASRTLLEAFPQYRQSPVLLWDRSANAREAAKSFFADGQRITCCDKPPVLSESVVLISHVLGELEARDLKRLMMKLEEAHTIIWVEPGTQRISTELVKIRERLRNGFQIVAPCNHSEECGMRSPNRKKDWCHFFATPPPEVFHEKKWADFARLFKIDIRSLPVSYLVLTKNSRPLENFEPTRVIGTKKKTKFGFLYLGCDRTGVNEYSDRE